MDWKLFSQLLTTFIVAILGSWLGHLLSAQRDLANERRKLRISYLIEAYRRLEKVADRLPEEVKPYLLEVESAIADIQLFGSEIQVASARTFVRVMAEKRIVDPRDLLQELRQMLRSELQLESIAGEVGFFRIRGRG